MPRSSRTSSTPHAPSTKKRACLTRSIRRREDRSNSSREVADQLADEVVDREHAGDSAVLVDDDRECPARLAHLGQDLESRPGFGDEDRARGPVWRRRGSATPPRRGSPGPLRSRAARDGRGPSRTGLRADDRDRPRTPGSGCVPSDARRGHIVEADRHRERDDVDPGRHHLPGGGVAHRLEALGICSSCSDTCADG